MKLESPNLRQLLLLNVLLPGQPLAVSAINKRINMILRIDKPCCYIVTSLNTLYKNEHIDYCNNGRKQPDGKKYVIITEQGKKYYRQLVKNFEEYYRTMDRIHTSISNNG